MDAVSAQGFGRYECELLTLRELEAFGAPLRNVLAASGTESSITSDQTAGPHTAVVISYLRHLERAYPRLWTKKSGTPGCLEGTMPGSPSSSPPPSPRNIISRRDSMSSNSSSGSAAAAAAAVELSEQWLNTFEEAKGVITALVSGSNSSSNSGSTNADSLSESLEWLVAVAPQVKALLAQENGSLY